MTRKHGRAAGMMPAVTHRSRKRFGQNFLHDKGIIDKILQAFDADPELPIVEIGPGKGALTLPLLRKTGSINVIEIDTDLAQQLAESCRGIGELKLHIGDALKFDFSSISPDPLQIIGNLPYNISTALMFHLLEDISTIKLMVLMLQKEVVDRICASPDETDYGRLSVMVQAKCGVEKLFSVAPGAFSPPPKVTSVVLKALPDITQAQSMADSRLFEQVVRQAFNQRRKTLRNALRGLVSESCLEALSISPTSRAENISVKDYINIANMLYKQQN